MRPEVDEANLRPVEGVTVVVPAHNEEKAIAQTVAQLLAVAPELGVPFQVLVVDDGSTDETGRIAAQAGATVLHHPQRGGYGRSLATGIVAAAHDTIAIVDADGTYPIEALPKLVARLPSFTMVVGARTGPLYKRELLRSPLRFFFLLLTRFVTGEHIPDPNSGLRVFRRSQVMPLLPELPTAFSFTTTLTLIFTLRGHFVDYVPIDYGPRIGRSKVRWFRDGLRVGQTMVQQILRHNPLKLFLACAVPPAVGCVATIPFWRTLGAGVPLALGAMALFVFALGMLAVVFGPRTPP